MVIVLIKLIGLILTILALGTAVQRALQRYTPWNDTPDGKTNTGRGPDGRTNTERDNNPLNRASHSMSRREALSILGLKDPVKLAQIHKAYRQMMKNVHPDQGGSDGLSILVRHAYKRLNDKETFR